MVCLLGGDNWSIGCKREMNSRVRYKIGLEFRQVDVESAVKTQGCGNGRYYLPNQTVEIGVSWSFNVEISTTDIVDSLVVNHETTI